LDPFAAKHYFDQSLVENLELRGWLAYADGRFDDAILAYSGSIKGARYTPRAARLHGCRPALRGSRSTRLSVTASTRPRE
jgi:hypothetical protein